MNSGFQVTGNPVHSSRYVVSAVNQLILKNVILAFALNMFDYNRQAYLQKTRPILHKTVYWCSGYYHPPVVYLLSQIQANNEMVRLISRQQTYTLSRSSCLH